MEIPRQAAEYWLDAARDLWREGKNTLEIADGISARFARRFSEADVYNRLYLVKPSASSPEATP